MSTGPFFFDFDLDGETVTCEICGTLFFEDWGCPCCNPPSRQLKLSLSVDETEDLED